MTTITNRPTTDTDTATATARRHDAAGRGDPGSVPAVTVRRVLLAELIKLRSVRSTTYALLTTVLAIAGLAVFAAVGATVQAGAPEGPDPTGGSLAGLSLAGYVIAALGVLAVTAEYRTGTIASTLAAVPRRGTVLVAKALAVAGVVFPVTVASTVGAFVAVRAVLATAGIDISLGEPGVLRAVVGGALYLTVVALLGSGLGWLLRSTAGALAALFGVLILLPVAALLLPAGLRAAVLPYLPDSAGMAIVQTTPADGQLAPWTGFAVFSAYAAGTLLAAAWALRRRDA
ncbi:MAG TPA: ABC transporter permease [Pilimelia sp.]|nr:ABC transporter permease [Pilimelia sp.]